MEYFVTGSDRRERPWCENPHGMLIYTADGFLSVAINCRRDVPADSPSKRFGDRLFYSGRYSLKNDREIVHHIETSSQVDQIGLSARRDFRFGGDDPILSGPPVNVLLGLRIQRRKRGE